MSYVDPCWMRGRVPRRLHRMLHALCRGNGLRWAWKPCEVTVEDVAWLEGVWTATTWPTKREGDSDPWVTASSS